MEKVLEAIRSGESFLIIGHVSPDGDTVGSAIALKRALIALGKQADIAAFRGNPDQDIEALDDVELVMKGGSLIRI